MTFGDAFGHGGLTRAEAEASLAELARARQRPYYDAEADRAASAAYYRGVADEDLGDLLRRTHEHTPAYKPARELYPWVDLQPDGSLRSIYTGHEWAPEDLILADLDVAAAREEALRSGLTALGVPGAAPTPDDAALDAWIEATLPYNCEHVVPQSWFAKREPMRGDLHHLFACESRCNSFRGNTPYTEFTDFPATPRADGGPAVAAVRGDCGKSESDGFEPARGKGAAARATFYFLLRYPGMVEAHEMPPERARMVLAWHEGDPVGEWERHRNAAIHERQGNRNPFIDRPELAAELLPAMIASVGP